MTTGIDTVGTDAPLSEIQRKIIDNKQRLLPVIKNGRRHWESLQRTDLLNVLVSKPARIPELSIDRRGLGGPCSPEARDQISRGTF